jgi:hypothetical protein
VCHNLCSNLDSTNKDIGDVDVENRKVFATLLNENMIYKNCPFILSCSVEFRNMPLKNQQESDIVTAIRTDETVKELIPKLPPGKTPTNLKSLCVIIAYMLRMSEIEGLQVDLDYILSKAPYLMEQML